MTGIGNTIETDLVGELIEVIMPSGGWGSERTSPRTAASGRCRAVTIDPKGVVFLWLEVVDEYASQPWNLPERPKVGDVFRISTDEGNGVAILRLRKER